MPWATLKNNLTYAIYIAKIKNINIYCIIKRKILMEDSNSQKNNNFYKYVEEHFEQFTNTEKRFVHFLLSNKFKAPFLSAYEIADRIKANSSTLVRFAKKIGFKGYPELQKNLGQLLVKEISYSSDFEKAKTFEEPKENNIIQVSLNKSYSNMLELLKDVDEQKIKLFSKKICSSRKKIIIANRSSYSAGHFLYFELNAIIPQVYFLSDYDHSYYDIFGDLNERDVIIAIGVPRYTKLTIDFAQYAVQKKLNVIAITDSPVSPLSSLSSICLFVPTQSATFHNSNVAMMALIDAVIAQVFTQKRETSIKRLERKEKVMKDKNITLL
jgi:DNA-binding MurR/RpiR family transcriptional regulator